MGFWTHSLRGESNSTTMCSYILSVPVRLTHPLSSTLASSSEPHQNSCELHKGVTLDQTRKILESAYPNKLVVRETTSIQDLHQPCGLNLCVLFNEYIFSPKITI